MGGRVEMIFQLEVGTMSSLGHGRSCAKCSLTAWEILQRSGVPGINIPQHLILSHAWKHQYTPGNSSRASRTVGRMILVLVIMNSSRHVGLPNTYPSKVDVWRCLQDPGGRLSHKGVPRKRMHDSTLCCEFRSYLILE